MAKIINYSFFIILLLNLQNSDATPVSPDYLVVNADTFLLYSNPLEYYFDIKGERQLGGVEFKGSGFYDNRGYVATWGIEEGRLYLLNIQSGKNQVSFTDEFYEDKVFANWYSGTLYSPQGRLIQYNHRPFASVYEKDVYYQVIDGEILKKEVSENVTFDSQRLFPAEQFLRDTITSIISAKLANSTVLNNINNGEHVLLGIGFCSDGKLIGFEVKYPKNENSVLQKVVQIIADEELPKLPPLMKVKHKYYEQAYVEVSIARPQ